LTPARLEQVGRRRRCPAGVPDRVVDAERGGRHGGQAGAGVDGHASTTGERVIWLKMSNLRVGARLGAGFLVVITAMVALTVIGVTEVHKINDRLTVVNDLNGVKQRYAINFRGSVHDRAIAVRDVVLASTAAEVQTEVDTIGKLTTKYDESADKMNGHVRRRRGRQHRGEGGARRDQQVQAKTLPLITQVVDLRTAGNNDQALQLLTTQARNVQTVAAGSEEMGASIREISQNASEAARVAARRSPWPPVTTETVSKLGESSPRSAT
jgi:methyl-accepting chemotaxis protein